MMFGPCDSEFGYRLWLFRRLFVPRWQRELELASMQNAIRKRAPEIAANIEANNTFLARLKEVK